MDPIQTIALSLGSAWASGLNLYAAVAVLGLMGGYGGIDLPPGLEILSNPIVISVALLMYIVEFFADKIPGLDSIWDAIHTFIRIPAGAILAANGLGNVDPGLMLAAGLAGGTLATATHATKAGTRLVINTSPEPFSNWAASVAEDLMVISGVWAALMHPYVFLALMVFSLILMAIFLPILWRGIKGIISALKGLFSAGGTKGQASPQTPVN
jgi:hypothetical protein